MEGESRQLLRIADRSLRVNELGDILASASWFCLHLNLREEI